MHRAKRSGARASTWEKHLLEPRPELASKLSETERQAVLQSDRFVDQEVSQLLTAAGYFWPSPPALITHPVPWPRPQQYQVALLTKHFIRCKTFIAA